MVNLIFNRFKDWWTSEKTCKALEAVHRDDFETHKAAWEAGKDCQILDLLDDVQPGCGCSACMKIQHIKEWMARRASLGSEVSSPSPVMDEARKVSIEAHIARHEAFVLSMEEAQRIQEEALANQEEDLREGVELDYLRNRVEVLENQNAELERRVTLFSSNLALVGEALGVRGTAKDIVEAAKELRKAIMNLARKAMLGLIPVDQEG